MKNWTALYINVMDCLQEKLSPFLIYHHWKHTEHVLKIAEYIARQEHIIEENIVLIKTAALFHDAGFINDNNEGHEEEGVLLAEKKLPNFGYTKKEIEIIVGMIRATEIPQKPKTKLECILADADLEYLGTDNFVHLGNKLYLELKHYNSNLSLEEWNEMQINFLQSHFYHTDYCLQNRANGKEKNMKELIQKQKSLEKF
ncbi:HD domain-containing protein [Flavobacterium urumqiense]|uniref:HD domain-containing protein n=1 Tax=Flavobacterium urumqiense TaxID=935224 RepID=A0A1H5ZQU5_9FLAO|nr:HD domain-containing protein [Flavobacterium urumqiense]SEG37766.1 HD domain-containing protein [Flavobacterium urumqiense]